MCYGFDMTIIATIQADLEVTPLGTRSRLADELRGVPLLRRTVERVRLTQQIDDVYVLCPENQQDRCNSILSGTNAIIRSHSVPAPPWASLVRMGRKWSLDGWRGGIGGTTSFDEYTNAALIDDLLRSTKADTVLSVPPAAPLFDPSLTDRMIQHHHKTEDDSRLTFTQAPPGVTGILLDAALVQELAGQGIPIGWVFSYKPDTPQKDLVFQPCCCEIPTELRYAAGRLVGDTERSMERLIACLQEPEPPDAVGIGRWLSHWEQTTAERQPHEVEIELTTDDPYPDSILRPRGTRIEPRGPIDPAIVARIVSEITQYDDALLVLGGFGDPLRHPQFSRIIETIRKPPANGRPPFGVAIRTTAADLSDEHIEALITNEVDVLDVTLDAWTPDLYGRLHSPHDPAGADLDTVCKRLDQLAHVRQEHLSTAPIVIAEMTKTRDNVHELDDFHDGWLRRTGAVLISGHSHFAGQCEDRSVIQMAPLPRVPCRRLRSRCVVLADGRVTMCDQDFNGRYALGSIHERSLERLWTTSPLSDLRDAHRQHRFDTNPLCAACDDWHRP